MTRRVTSRSAVVLSLCFAAAVVEGFDMQSAGVAAPAMARHFSLSPQQTGLVFTASTAGLLLGAFIGGRIADRLGRKAGLLISLSMVVIFSFGTALSNHLGLLLAMRFLAGLGMGGAMPSLIAAAAESAPAHRVRSTVAAIYAGFPTGGALVSLFSLLDLHGGWRAIFVLGGLLPLVMLGVIAIALRLPPPAETATISPASDTSLSRTLFSDSRLTLTLMLWIALFSSLLVLYVLQNWLPTLLIAKEFSRVHTGTVQFLMNVGGAIGCYGVGQLLDRFSRSRVVAVNTLILVVSLGVIAIVQAPGLAFVSALPLGLALNASQAILYSIAPTVYPASIRGTGVGAALAVARLGSITGPLLASVLLVRGMTANAVLLFLLPIVAVAGVVTLLLVRLQDRSATPS